MIIDKENSLKKIFLQSYDFSSKHVHYKYNTYQNGIWFIVFHNQIVVVILHSDGHPKNNYGTRDNNKLEIVY